MEKGLRGANTSLHKYLLRIELAVSLVSLTCIFSTKPDPAVLTGVGLKTCMRIFMACQVTLLPECFVTKFTDVGLCSCVNQLVLFAIPTCFEFLVTESTAQTISAEIIPARRGPWRYTTTKAQRFVMAYKQRERNNVLFNELQLTISL